MVSVNKTHVDYLKEIANNTSRHHDISILLTSNSNSFITNIYPPLQFDDTWRVGMMNFSVHNNIQNITTINTFLGIQLMVVQLGN